MLLHESKHLYATFQKGTSDFLLITFGYNGMKADGVNFWAKGLCERLGYNVIGFVSHKADWFPKIHMEAAIRDVLPKISEFPRRIAYGSSMGGYTALKYGKPLQVDTVLAYSPQFTLDPSVVGSFDTKCEAVFDPAIHTNMEPREDIDFAERVFVLYDERNALDAGHAALLRDSSERVQFIKMPNTGHATGRVFAGSAKASSLIEAALSNDVGRLRAVASACRRSSGIRATLLTQQATQSHPAWAAGIAERCLDRFDQYDRSVVRAHMAKIIRSSDALLQKLPDGSPQRTCLLQTIASARKVSAVPVNDPSRLLKEAADSANRGDVQAAIRLARQAVEAAPKFGTAYHALAGHLLTARDFEGARAAAQAATDYDPDNEFFRARHATAEDQTGRLDNAVEAAKLAVSCAPNNPRIRDLLAAFLEKAGRREEAFRHARLVMALEPDSVQYMRRLARLAEALGLRHVALETAHRLIAADANDALAGRIVASQQRATMQPAPVGETSRHRSLEDNISRTREPAL